MLPGLPTESDLPADWVVKRFGSLLSEPVRNGIYKEKELHGRGTKIVNMGELFGFDFLSDQEMNRVELTDKELEKWGVRGGDLLFARRSLKLEGSGKCSLVVSVPEPTVFESSIIRARPDADQVDPRFLFYLFRSPIGRALMASIASRTAVSGIRGSDLVELSLPVPPLGAQKAISLCLKSFDSLVERNSRRIQILEEMARTIYRKWFVNFHFPGHENVELVESELGPVPRGWDIVPLSEAIEINPRLKFDKEQERPYVPMGAVSQSSFVVEPAEMRKGRGGSRFQNGDTLFARINPSLQNGKTAFVQFLPSDSDVAIGSTEFIVFRSRSLCPELVQLMARSSLVRDPAIKSMVGASGRQRVQLDIFDQVLIPQPPPSVIQDFQSLARPMFRLAWSLARQNAVLRETRDLLLPKLLSGEISVEDLDSTLKEAVA